MRFLTAILLAAVTASDAPAHQLEQHAGRPADSIGSALDLLGLSQPESVRSILLLYTGKSISKSKAAELEAGLKQTPEKIDERLTLIGYYTSNAHDGLDKLRLRAHVLWIIGNHPEHPATAEPGLRDLADDPAGNNQVLELWQRNLESRPDDIAVL